MHFVTALVNLIWLLVMPSAVVSVYQNLYFLQVIQVGCVVTAFDGFLFYNC
jgi:hypothetical protein